MDCSRKTLVLNYSSNYRVSPFIKFEYDILFKVEMIKGKKKREYNYETDQLSKAVLWRNGFYQGKKMQLVTWYSWSNEPSY